MREKDFSEKELKRIGRAHPKVLIAGGASFLGTRLSKKLLDYGFQVLVLDNFSSGKRDDFKALCSRKRFKFITCDISEELPEVARGPLDFVFHLARLGVHSASRQHRTDPASASAWGEMRLSTLLTNALGTKNLLDLVKKARAIDTRQTQTNPDKVRTGQSHLVFDPPRVAGF